MTEDMMPESIDGKMINVIQDMEWKFPLFLSCLAGASTCIGAAIVFVWSPSVIQQSMTFSLSLAASVMITVSAISIGPECMEGVFLYDTEHLVVAISYGTFLQRLLCFGMGCLGYYLLSKVLVHLPEPETFFSTNKTDKLEDDKDIECQKFDSEEERRTNTTNTTTTRRGRTLSASSSSLSTGSSSPSPQTSPDRNIIQNQRQTSTASRRSKATTGMTYRASSSGLSNIEPEGKPIATPPYKGNKTVDMETLTPLLVTGTPALAPSHSSCKDEEEERKRSWRVALLLFVSLLLHNFPEGLAVVASTVESQHLGITVALGIAAHNIPEGIAIAVPCLAAHPQSPWLAFAMASGSGLAEPLGAAIALTFFRGKNSNGEQNLPLQNILACVAGIMCMVAVVELYPEAYRHLPTINSRGATKTTGSNHWHRWKSMISGTLSGILLMVATEWYV